jgi:NAD(P)-dependent dehydrogenase (short-subunit alcohol dehydrogenase family)
MAKVLITGTSSGIGYQTALVLARAGHSLNDEEWAEWGALSDEAWYERVAKDFGLDARAKRTAAVHFAG